MTLITPLLKIEGFIQYGARSFHRCTEVVMIVRLIIENAKEWGYSWVIISLNIESASENVKLCELLKHWEEAGVPVRLRDAAFKEIALIRFVPDHRSPTRLMDVASMPVAAGSVSVSESVSSWFCFDLHCLLEFAWNVGEEAVAGAGVDIAGKRADAIDNA